MDVIILYHGTNIGFDVLDPSHSRSLLDFGSGSYLTVSREQAWGMAVRKFKIFGGTPTLMAFDFDGSQLTDREIKIFDGYSVEWTEFVIRNRYFSCFDNPYKVIAGPVADGTIPDDIDDYMERCGEEWSRVENLEILTQKLKFENKPDYIQYCFRDSDVIRRCLKLKEKYNE